MGYNSLSSSDILRYRIPTIAVMHASSENYNSNRETVMPTDKGKDNVQPDTKEDKRHKFINDIDAMIKELRDLTDEVEHDILKLRQSCSHATISNQNQGQGQDKGASSWSAAPEDVDTDKCFCLPEDNTGR
ncbi:unnamed protein product [Fusarium graminearum]|nr:unnamed protein product [Fusarium graminearum]CAG1995523.1 unnamed protein product [Fusarium graminearum]